MLRNRQFKRAPRSTSKVSLLVAYRSCIYCGRLNARMTKPSLHDVERNSLLTGFNSKRVAQCFRLAKSFCNACFAHDRLHQFPSMSAAPWPQATDAPSFVPFKSVDKRPRNGYSSENTGSSLLEGFKDNHLVRDIYPFRCDCQGLRDPRAGECHRKTKHGTGLAFV